MIHQDKRKNRCDLAKVLPVPYEAVLIVYEEGKEKKRTVRYNAIGVKLPSYPHKLCLVEPCVWDGVDDVVDKL